MNSRGYRNKCVELPEYKNRDTRIQTQCYQDKYTDLLESKHRVTRINGQGYHN